MTTNTHTELEKSLCITGLLPLFAKIRNGLALLSALTALLASLYLVVTFEHIVTSGIYSRTGYHTEPYMLWGACLVVTIASWGLARVLLTLLLSFRKSITITENQIKYWRLFRLRVFDRKLPTRFVLENHPKADAERDRHAYLENKARLKGKAVKPRKYYQNSRLLCLEHMGVSHPVISIYDPHKANDGTANSMP